MRISLRYALSDAEPGKGRIVQMDGQASFTGQIRLPFLYGAGQFRCVHDYFSGQPLASETMSRNVQTLVDNLKRDFVK